MNATGLPELDSTLQKTAIWLKEIMAELESQDRHLAYLALRSTLHALRDRLPIEEAVHLGAQLPLLIRGVYYEGWRVADKPLKEHRAEFLGAISRYFRDTAPDPERVARAVFKVLEHHVTAGEIEDVRQLLPRDLRDLWPEEEACAPAFRAGSPARP
ncbi:MAG: DUF2267 domain-containing protein [Candidatus Binatia bacterium]